MISVVTSTNRPGSRSAVVANEYVRVLKEAGAEVELLALDTFTPAMIEALLYTYDKDRRGFDTLQEHVTRAEKFVFVIPEYNGSYPGILKVFVDCLSYPDSFDGKKAALIGISSGTQGASLAMGHFADVLNYVGTHTLALRPRFIRINEAVVDGKLVDDEYQGFIELQSKQLMEF